MTTRQSSLRLKTAAFVCFAFTPLLNPLVRHWRKVSSFAKIGLVTTVLMGIGLFGQRAAADQPAVARQHGVNGTVATPVSDSWPGSLPPQSPLWWDGRAVRSRSRAAGRKKVKRTRAEIQREQKELLERTNREIDAIVAEFHKKLPRSKAKSIGCAYCRYSSRFQDSIGDQLRKIFETACELGIFIAREHVYFDTAVRGYKDRRPGLSAMKKAIARKQVQVFLAFTTSRVFRRAYKAQQFVEETLVENGVRAVFLQPRIDTDGNDWRLMFQMLCAMDENMVRMIGSHVRASHEGLFIRGMVCTSLSLGFTGEDVPGEMTKRKRPRQRIIVDTEAAEWIEKIYQWYVNDGMSMSEIARVLNDDDEAPAPAKSLTGLWTQQLVRKHLLNPCYRGYWVYGATKTKWLSKKDYAKQVPRDEPLKSGHFKKLRIVSDELWFKAQDLLAKERAKSGRKVKRDDGIPRPRFLRGLFVCPDHNRQLVVGGAYGRVLFCPLCRAIKAEQRPLYTHLNRGLALRLTCDKLAELIRADDHFVAEIIAACQGEVERQQSPDPAVLNRLQTRLEKIDNKIYFNRRNPGDTDEEQATTAKLIKELGAERAEIIADLAARKAAQNRKIEVPTTEQVREMMVDLGEILTTAASAETDKEMRTARRIIDELTDGRIELFQEGERKAQRGWLQGRFRVDLVSLVIDKLSGIRPVTSCGSLEVVIDYRRELLINEQSEEAKQFWDRGMLGKEIAHEMGCLPCYVTKLLHHWFDSRGLPRPDNRRRRKELKRKQTTTPVFQEIADKVVRLVEEGHSNLSIAQQLKVSDFTVGKAIAWWFKSRGLPVPTAADRRRKTLARAKEMYDDGALIKNIAAELGYTARGLKLALKKYLAELGECMSDGRARRGNTSAGARASGHAVNDDDGEEGDQRKAS